MAADDLALEIATAATEQAVSLTDLAAVATANADAISAILTDASNAASAAATSADEAEASADEALAHMENAKLFAESPKNEPFSIGDESFLSARHYAEVTAEYAQASAYIPARDATAAELSANKVVVGAADLFGCINVNNASGTVDIEISPTIWQQAGGKKEAFVRIRREGAGAVRIVSSATSVSPVVLGRSVATGRYQPTEKAAGTVTGTVRKFAGNDRRMYLFLWTVFNASDASRNVTATLSSGETLTKIVSDQWTGGVSGINLCVYRASLANATADADVTLTVTHGAGLWAWAGVAVTVGNSSGDELIDPDYYSTNGNSFSQTITPAGAKRLVLFGAGLLGGDGNPCTVNRGTLQVEGDSGGNLGTKDISFLIASEQLEVAAATTYTAGFLASDSRAGAILAIQPGSVVGGTIKAPGGRVLINERYGVATVILPGDGSTIRIEGDMA